MKNNAPTVQEIKEFKEEYSKMSFTEMVEAGVFKDNRKKVMLNTMTEPLMRHYHGENVTDIWNFCKKLAGYAHAPVSPAEYKRVMPYMENPDIVDAILASLNENHYPFFGKILPDVQGYYYCIALLSQSEYKRVECLAFLTELTDYFIREIPDNIVPLKRNMKVLKKEFPDLDPLFKKLEEID